MKNTTFGKQLKSLRSILGKNQKDFAEYVNIPQPSLSAYENDKNSPTLDVLIQITDKCGVSIDWLCGRTISTVDTVKQQKKDRVKQCESVETIDEFINELVQEIMSEIYFDDINKTTCTLERFEEFSPMYEIKKEEIINLVKEKFKDITIIKGRPLN